MTHAARPLLPACLLLAIAAPVRADDARGLELFEKKIRPLLAENCYECHSADAAAKNRLKGGLLLDSRDGLRKGGDSGPAVVPGKPAASRLVKALHYDGKPQMPPRGKLPANAIADVEAWVALGAPDPRAGGAVRQRGMSLEDGRKFWAYRPVAKPALPKVAAELRNEIDAFIAAKLEAKGLRFAPEADPATLVRRVYFDLVGLPPSPEEIDAFLKEFSAKPQAAYEGLVDRLLASPQFGERWGRHWLDVARFAESITLRGSVFKEAWRYRDYVIDSFNRDVPFDRFVREQVAGDLLPAADTEQRRRQLIATTFLALGNNNLEEQDKQQLVMDVVDEQLDAISKAFLAQTVTCARCHDHKFDPIPTKDYYALAGILRNTKTLKHANVSQWLEVPLPADPERERVLKAHEAEVAALQKEIIALKSVVAKGTKPADPARPRVRAVAELPGIVVDDAQARKVGTWKESKFSGSYVGAGYIHDEDQGKGAKTLTFQPEIPKTGRYEVRLAYSPGTNRCSRVPVTIFSADGEKTVYVDQQKPPEIEGLFHVLGQFKFERSGQGFVIIANEGTKGHVIADAVVFIPVEKLPELKESRPEVNETAKPDVERLKALEEKLKKLTATGPKRDLAMSVEEEKAIEDVRVHVRGSVHNLGDVAPRGVLRVALTGPAPTFPADQSGRVQLAEWLAGKDNPLPARVFSNRAWHWLFGAGLVRTTDNFGTTGESPSHPELLDYLASRFVEEGWSVKKLVRAIVLSRTYRQAATADPASEDPENRLLSHQNRRRLDAECIRDAILSVSGQLTTDAGGPTFKPDLSADYGYKHTDTRRSVYSPVFRNALPEIFEAFDFADPSVCTGRRNVSTVAPQALFLMNNPFILKQSEAAAQRLLGEKGDDAARLTRAFRLALGRPPTAGERRAAEAFLAKASDEKARSAAWAQLVQALFASIDFRYVD
jgi:hypothetical protein